MFGADDEYVYRALIDSLDCVQLAAIGQSNRFDFTCTTTEQNFANI